MRVVSSLLRRTLYPSLAKVGFFRSWRSGKMREYLTIVTYHGVLPPNYKVEDRWLDGHLVKPDAFRQQLRLLKSHYDVISPEELYASLERNDDVPPNSVLLTCDDGLLNNVTDMLPILKEERLPCLFFVTAGCLRSDTTILWHEELYLLLKLARNGPIQVSVESVRLSSSLGDMGQRRAVWWRLVEGLSGVAHRVRRQFVDALRQQIGLAEDWNSVFLQDPTLRRRFLLLSPAQLKDLANSGMVLGSHTCSHPMLASLPADLASREIEESRHSLERLLGIRVWALAYPFGDPTSVTSREMLLTERAGYKCAFVNFGGLVPRRINQPFALPRVHVTAEMTIAEFEAHVSGFHWVLRAKLRGSENLSA